MASVTSVAQQGSPLNGNWVAQFTAPNGMRVAAKVVIRDGHSGTWQVQGRNPNNNCVGLEMPVSVGKVEPDGFEFAVAGSKALAGCEDFVVQMKRADDKRFEGQAHGGFFAERKLVLTRQ